MAAVLVLLACVVAVTFVPAATAAAVPPHEPPSAAATDSTEPDPAEQGVPGTAGASLGTVTPNPSATAPDAPSGTGSDAASPSAAVPVLTPGTTVRTPCPTTIEGIDVSQFQGDSIGWAAVKASGRQFAYARALDGIGTHDTRFVQNY